MQSILITLLACICFSTFANSCPDFSGKYIGTYQNPRDFRYQKELEWTQIECNEFTIKGRITFKNDSEPTRFSFSAKISSHKGDDLWYWENGELIYLQKNATTEGCDIRDIYYQDDYKNLRFKWRFECQQNYTPSYVDGNSPWFASNTGGLYLKVE